MRTPGLPLNSTFHAWHWWAAHETLGREYVRKTKSGKYQRERWHLRGLHSKAFLSNVVEALGEHLAIVYEQPAAVGVDSIWIDQTPQAAAKYLSPKGRSHAVKCELADLLIVTMTGFGGSMPRARDIQAVLLQAKVTAEPGVLEADAAPSSSFKERNLLERCHSDIDIHVGTGTSQPLGTFDLGCSKNPGLSQFASYLTIPRESIDDDYLYAYPYQSMWPLVRSAKVGNASSLGDALRGMMGPMERRTTGCAFEGPGVPPAWPRLVAALTGKYMTETVNRFTKAGATPFPRVLHSRSNWSHFLGRADLDADSWALARALPWGGGSGRDGGAGGADPHEEDDAAKMPVLVVRANVGSKGYEPPPDESAQNIIG